MRCPIDRLIAAGALLALAVAAHAQRPALDDGPLEISADRAELRRDGSMRYSGNVEFSNERLRVTGDELTLTQTSGAGVIIDVRGAPASLRHTPPEGDDARPVDAEASHIRFRRQDNLLELEGGVRLQRGGDRLTGDALSYDLNEERIIASGGSQGRVHITIDPETLQERR